MQSFNFHSAYLTRREFLQASAGCAFGLVLSEAAGFTQEASQKPMIGFQLYTLRGEFSRDVPGTLKKLAQIGYQGVEFWAYGGTPNVYQQYSAAKLKALLDENALQCCGIHMDLKALVKENFQRTIDNNQVLGNKYLNVAAAKEHMASDKGIGELASLLNEAAVQCRPHKMLVGYHAHGFDFARINGKYGWELLFDRTLPEVNMQMDVGNCLGGDGDPIAMLRKFPGRARTIHIKEHEDKTFESAFYKEVFQLCQAPATTWYIIEMGGSDGNGFDVPGSALARLRKALK